MGHTIDPSVRPALRRTLPAALIAPALLVLGALLVLLSARPPRPVPESAPLTEFSSGRAMKHLAVIAAEPHPPGSVAHEEVRSYIMRELGALGLAPAEQAATVYRASRGTFAGVKNIVARRAGTGSGKALVLMAHYDSHGMTPAAGDDGAAVAALLETARALEAGRPLARDILYLITDGEEAGLFGAKAFVEEHPWANDAGLVLNFEARGDRGQVLMFQTSDGNGELIRALRRAAPYPVASSLAQEIYKRMPNDTDLSEWLPKTQGLNFAAIEGGERYHAPTDTVANLDEGMLQHHGSYALALARDLGDKTLPLPATSDATYFNLGPLLVVYPGALALPLAAVATALLLWFIRTATRKGIARGGHVVYAALGAFVAVATAAAACHVVWKIVAELRAGFDYQGAAAPTVKGLFLGSFFAFGLAVSLASIGLMRRLLKAAEVFAGGAVVFCLLTIVASLGVPGGAYLFVWPLLFAAAIGVLLVRTSRFDAGDLGSAALRAAMALPAVLILIPFALLIFTAFGLGGASLVGAVTALVVVLGSPALEMLRGRFVAVGAAAVGAILYIAANLTPPFNAAYPKPDSLLAAVDQDKHKAYWLSTDAARDSFTGKVLSGGGRGAFPLPFPLRYRGPYLGVDIAEKVTEPGPDIAWTPDLTPPDQPRSLQFHVVPPPRSELLGVAVPPPIVSARVQGKPVSLRPGEGLVFKYLAPPKEGVEILLEVPARPTITVHVLSQRRGFPDELAAQAGTRPEGLMARPAAFPPWDEMVESDTTIVAKTFTH